MTDNKLINLVNITKSYGDNVVLDDLNLYIRENEFVTLLGPSDAERQQHCGLSADLKRRIKARLYSKERT